MFAGSLYCFGSTAFNDEVVEFETILRFVPLRHRAQIVAAIPDLRIRLEAQRECGLVRVADGEVGASAWTRQHGGHCDYVNTLIGLERLLQPEQPVLVDGAVVLEVVQIEK